MKKNLLKIRPTMCATWADPEPNSKKITPKAKIGTARVSGGCAAETKKTKKRKKSTALRSKK